MGDPLLWVEERHDEFAVTAHAGCPEHRLALLDYVFQELLAVLAAIYA